MLPWTTESLEEKTEEKNVLDVAAKKVSEREGKVTSLNACKGVVTAVSRTEGK